MSAKEWLEQVKKLDQLINAKLAERDRLKDIATDISPKMPDGMPGNHTGSVSQRMQNAVCALVDLEHKLDGLIDKYIDCKQKVVKALEQLPEKEYGVLHRHYIKYMTWEKVAEDMGYSTVHVWRIKNSAIEHLDNILQLDSEKYQKK